MVDMKWIWKQELKEVNRHLANLKKLLQFGTIDLIRYQEIEKIYLEEKEMLESFLGIDKK